MDPEGPPNLLPRPRTVDLGDRLIPPLIVEERFDDRLPPQGYELFLDDDGVRIVAADEPGRFYAQRTLGQLALLHHGEVPTGVIRDHPDLLRRGVMIDLSHGKVPTISTLSALVDLLASWKINQLWLNVAQPIAGSNDPELLGADSPLSAQEIAELDAHCRAVHVELVPGGLPDPGTACEWGFDASHPFDRRAGELADDGAPFWLCPGTSSWRSILGRWSNARDNCRRAVRAAIAHGASGVLITDRGDDGHLQQLPVSEPAIAYGAAISWCLAENEALDVAEALNVHAFDDPSGALGAALLELGDAYLATDIAHDMSSTIVGHLYLPQLEVGRGPTAISAADVDELDRRLARGRTLLRRARPRRADGDQVLDELTWSIDLVALLADDLRLRLAGDGTLGSIDPIAREALAERIGELIVRHRHLWLARNRPDGLAGSAGWLEHLRRSYERGHADPGWGVVSG